MTRNPQIAKRYAKAFFSIWVDRLNPNELKNVIKASVELSRVLLQNAEVKIFWQSTSFHMEEKNILVDYFKDQNIKTEVIELLSFLVKRRRPEILSDVTQSLLGLYHEHTHTLLVSISSAFKLSNEDKKEMESIVSTLKVAQGHICEFDFNVDERLFGGMLIRIGRFVYDFSLKSSFEKLKRKVEMMDLREFTSPAENRATV
jgi:F-type H+-transporting ATPase subunit delta